MNKVKRKCKSAIPKALSGQEGFATIYILLIMGTLMFLIMVIIEVSSGFAAQSITNDACFVTGRSLLAEYNKPLFKRYGLFALKADEDELKAKVREYMNTDLKVNKCVVKLKLDSAVVDTSAYAALDGNAFIKQVSKLGLICMAENIIQEPEKNVIVTGHPTVPGSNLPSQLLGFHSRELVLLSGGMLEISPTVIAADEYILSFCSNQLNQLQNTYLVNEIEYILFGYSTDGENLASIRRSIYGVLYAKNLAEAGEIPTDPIEAAVILIQIALETETDLEEIMGGGEVDGMNYSSYLRAFLSLLENDEKMARLMDIVQLNLQYIDGSSFSFIDYAYGFDLTARFSKKVVTAEFAGTDRRYRTVVQAHSYK